MVYYSIDELVLEEELVATSRGEFRLKIRKEIKGDPEEIKPLSKKEARTWFLKQECHTPSGWRTRIKHLNNWLAAQGVKERRTHGQKK